MGNYECQRPRPTNPQVGVVGGCGQHYCTTQPHRLADLMEAHKEELATLESVDSGAVYTLALKTHVGFSIDTFRYFGAWCDKIHGSTIPINNARPNANLCFTKKEPLGCVRVGITHVGTV